MFLHAPLCRGSPLFCRSPSCNFWKSPPPFKGHNYDGYGWQEGTPLQGESWSLLIDAYFYLVTSGPRFGTHWFLPWRSWEVLYEVLGRHQESEWEPCTSIILNIRGMPWNFVQGFWKGLWLLQLEQDEQDNAADMCEHGQGSSEIHYPISPILKFEYTETIISHEITYL